MGGKTKCMEKSFAADCSQKQTNGSSDNEWVIGTMVWTLFDYYGEPSGGWPLVIGSYGQFDLAGFPKAQAYWYRSQWLYNISDDRADKTFDTGNQHIVHLVESWESPDVFPDIKGNRTRNITAFTDAASVELFVNEVPQGVSLLRSYGSVNTWAEWNFVPWQPGNLIAVARDAQGWIVAIDTRFTSGQAASLELRVDAPAHATGTGSSLVLDGHDAALVRASIVDAAGRVVHMATHNVSFRVLSGPGRIVGAHNGDVHCHEPNGASWHSAYHGLVRAVVQVTSAAGRSAYERSLLAIVDADTTPDAYDDWAGDAEIVLEASADGLVSDQVSIAVSTDLHKDSVMATAEAYGSDAVNFD